MRPFQWALIGTLVVVTAGCALRPTLGRSRPDLAALLSFDRGWGTFERTYSSGKVGPFNVGDSRSVARERLSTFPLVDEDKPQLSGRKSNWRVALPARSGGYNIYTVDFEGERIASVKAFYSVFAGL
jgi:hypothetical protein